MVSTRSPSGPAAASAWLPTGLPERASEAAALMKALANADRLLLLCALVEGERCVTDLGEYTGLTQPSLSQQLSVLRAQRLVATRRDGKRVLYRVASPEALQVLQVLQGLYCPPAPRVRRTARSRA